MEVGEAPLWPHLANGHFAGSIKLVIQIGVLVGVGHRGMIHLSVGVGSQGFPELYDSLLHDSLHAFLLLEFLYSLSQAKDFQCYAVHAGGFVPVEFCDNFFAIIL